MNDKDIEALFSGRYESEVLKKGVVDDDMFEDEQPSYEKVMSGEFKSPSALEGTYATFEGFQLVGHALKPTNERCGTFRKFVGCSRVELHNKAVFDKGGRLVDCRGKGFFRPVFHSCDKPSCPVCYERGWAVREAKNIQFRLEQASKRFGLAEHVIVSVPSKDYGLSYEAMRKKVINVLNGRGVVGGCLIFHGARYNLRQQWYWSPHFHVLGFILGGYGECRNCKDRKCVGFGNFSKCDGFEARTRRLNERDGYIVKVKGKRKTVFGTGWYQLHHSTIRTDVKCFHVATWFGVCSYRKLKISKELRKEWDELHKPKCPICGHDLVRHAYYGRESSILAYFRKRRGSRESVKGVFDKASEWFELPERGSGSYE